MRTQLLETLEDLAAAAPALEDLAASPGGNNASSLAAVTPTLSQRADGHGPHRTVQRLTALSGSVRLAEHARRISEESLFEWVRDADGRARPQPHVAEPPAFVVETVAKVCGYAGQRMSGLRAATERRTARTRRSSDAEWATPDGLRQFIRQGTALGELAENTRARTAERVKREAALAMARFVVEPQQDLLFRNIKAVRGELQAIRDEVVNALATLGGTFGALLRFDHVYHGALSGKVSQLVVDVVHRAAEGLAHVLLSELGPCVTQDDVLQRVDGWFAEGVIGAHEDRMRVLGNTLLELEYSELETLLDTASHLAAGLEPDNAVEAAGGWGSPHPPCMEEK